MKSTSRGLRVSEKAERDVEGPWTTWTGGRAPHGLCLMHYTMALRTLCNGLQRLGLKVDSARYTKG